MCSFCVQRVYTAVIFILYFWIHVFLLLFASTALLQKRLGSVYLDLLTLKCFLFVFLCFLYFYFYYSWQSPNTYNRVNTFIVYESILSYREDSLVSLCTFINYLIFFITISHKEAIIYFINLLRKKNMYDNNILLSFNKYMYTIWFCVKRSVEGHSMPR